MLVPPNRKLHVETAPNARTFANKPVFLLDTRHVDGSNSRPIPFEAMENWLLSHGFSVRQRYDSATELVKDDMEAFLANDHGELGMLDLTFTLSRHNPNRWEAWYAVVIELCATWHLGLADAKHETTVGPSDFTRLLEETPSWRDFQRAFGWPSITQSK
jgi:hypothetical protein